MPKGICERSVRVLVISPSSTEKMAAEIMAKDREYSMMLFEIKKALDASEEDMEAIQNKIVSLPGPNSYTLESLHGYVMRGDLSLKQVRIWATG